MSQDTDIITPIPTSNETSNNPTPVNSHPSLQNRSAQVTPVVEELFSHTPTAVHICGRMWQCPHCDNFNTHNPDAFGHIHGYRRCDYCSDDYLLGD